MDQPAEPSYLTCTAAQADDFNTSNPHGFVSLNQLLESRALSHPDVAIAGFPEQATANHWRTITFTYASLLSSSNAVAQYYVEESYLCPRIGSHRSDRIIGLLSPSCADFLIAVFAALRLGYGVLLLAPQNTHQAINYLCEVTSCTHLVCHPSLVQHGQEAVQENSRIRIISMAPRSIWQNSPPNLPLLPLALSPEEEKGLIALVMHTSGSTGMPKPIYHTHKIWTEAIPCMPGKPAFTTTPLYHGGSADLLRSMNALSMLYLFPSTYPMTVTNIIGSITACPDVTAFLSVPYILKLLAEDSRGMQMLQGMDLVSTGGAPLPDALGDEMVRQGVRLVSRLGSSECGFLMSSHRHYEADHEWSWLRNSGPGEKMLLFEPVRDSESMFELIVPKAWSTRVASNREDESFATGDLYSKHPTIPHAWRYCGRIDDIIVMTNGKKASANPMETALRASPYIAEAVVFGTSRPVLGTLIVPASAATTEERIRSCVHEINQGSASYAQIPDAMIIVLPSDAPLPKTSKGSVVRPRALVQYASVINKAYDRLENGEPSEDESEAQLATEVELRQYVRHLVQSIVASRRKENTAAVDDDEDLFVLGVDSVHAIAIRGSLQKLVSPSNTTLGSNVVFEYPSINRLVAHVLDVRARREATTVSWQKHQHERMRELLDKYGNFVNYTEITARHVPCGPHIIVLTGATGALGAHVLSHLVETSALLIVTLVRAENNAQAKKRIEASLRQRNLSSLQVTAGFTAHSAPCSVVALSADLTQDRLGLDEDVYERLMLHLESILHVAWPVNFALHLDSFSAILQGTRNIINLACKSYAGRFIFCSSTATASCTENGASVPESLPRSEENAVAMGYARAKWVAEHICARAHRGPLEGRVAIARIGQLCGDTVHGIWNESEAWPLMIASVRYTSCLPDLVYNPSWLPVDIAAKVLTEISFAGTSWCQRSQVPVYHVVNPVTTTSWSDILDYLSRSGLSFDRVCPNEWMNRLRAREADLDTATRNLLNLWESTHCPSDRNAKTSEPRFDTSLIADVCTSMKGVASIPEALVQKFYHSWRTHKFL